MATAERVLPNVPNSERNKIARFLESQGNKRIEPFF